MQLLKNTKRLFVMLVIGGASAAATAGVPTFDASNIAQSVMQVQAWAKQNLQMADQIKKSIEQLKQMTEMTDKLAGMRNLGTILNNPAIAASLPPAMRDAAAMLLNPSGPANNPAALAALLSSFGVTGTGNGGQGNTSADNLLNMQSILSSAQMRQTQIGQLASRVDSAKDAKESIDLLNRNTLEAATINNQVLQTMASIEAAKEKEKLREIARSQAHFQAMQGGIRVISAPGTP